MYVLIIAVFLFPIKHPKILCKDVLLTFISKILYDVVDDIREN